MQNNLKIHENKHQEATKKEHPLSLRFLDQVLVDWKDNTQSVDLRITVNEDSNYLPEQAMGEVFQRFCSLSLYIVLYHLRFVDYYYCVIIIIIIIATTMYFLLDIVLFLSCF